MLPPVVPPPSPVSRTILAFEPDEPHAWIARLDCGHRRHIRHRPPLSSYPWILDDVARAAKVGAAIECERCARRELPEGAGVYRTTDEFDEDTLPAGLRRAHTTRRGVWGRVEVSAGRLRFVMPALGVDAIVVPGEPALIPPEIEHHVEPLGPVRLRVAFLRVGEPGAA